MEHSYYSQNLLDDVNMESQIYQFEENNKNSDELLIDAVRGYPHLYNPFLREYKDIKMKDNSWHEIALLLNMSVDNCQTRWLRLRERFTKEQRFQETESRSGSKASHRSVFPFYQNMLFLKKYIKRRQSYTNVAKKRTTDVSDVCVNTTNTSLHYSDTHADSFSSSNMMPKEITPKTNFSQHSRDTNLQTTRNVVHYPCISQRINLIETDDDESSSSLQNELDDSSHRQMKSATLNSTSSLSPSELHKNTALQTNTASISNSTSSFATLQTPNALSFSNSLSVSPTLPKYKIKEKYSGKIKDKNSTYLESSLASLSDTIHKRFNSTKIPTDNKENAWDLNNLTPEKSFGLLIAIELERIPEPEKSKRKQAISEILWKPYIP